MLNDNCSRSKNLYHHPENAPPLCSTVSALYCSKYYNGAIESIFTPTEVIVANIYLHIDRMTESATAHKTG